MRPWIRRVDVAREPEQLGADPLQCGVVLGRHPVLADVGSVDQVEPGLAGLGDVARHQLEPQLRGQPEVRVVHLADDLPAHLHGAAVIEHDALDAAADAAARLDEQDVGAGPREVAGTREAGESAADHQGVECHRPQPYARISPDRHRDAPRGTARGRAHSANAGC